MLINSSVEDWVKVGMGAGLGLRCETLRLYPSPFVTTRLKLASDIG